MGKLSGLAVAGLLALSGAASAALVQFSAVTDLTGCPNNGPGFCITTVAIAPVTIAVGDTVDYTINFADSERLAMFDETGNFEQFYGWMFNPQVGGFFTISDASIDFLALSGTLLEPLFVASQTNGTAHIGPAFFGDFIAAGSGISFDGYHVHYTVDALPADPDTYSVNAMFAIADRVEVRVAPEPSTLALGVLGLAAAFSARQRLRRALRRSRGPRAIRLPCAGPAAL